MMDCNFKKKISISYRRWILKKYKSKKLVKFLPYTNEQAREYFEKFFTNEINWNNYGKKWQIDHIVPSCIFNENEIQLWWSLENLRVIENNKNRMKSASIYESLLEIKKRIKFNPDNENLQKLLIKIEILLKSENIDENFYNNLFIFKTNY